MKKISLLLTLLLCATNTHAQERIISAGAGITELLIALEAKPQLIAIDSSSKAHAPKDIPMVGYHRQLSTEGLLALTPTLLIGSQDMGPKTTIETLKNSDVNVLTLPRVTNVSGLIDQVTTLANVTQTNAQGKQLIHQIEQLQTQLQNKKPLKSPSFLFLMLSESGKILSAGKNTPVHTVIELAGGKNALAEKDIENYKPISIEAILEMDPDYLLIPARTLKKHLNHSHFLTAYPWLKTLTAVQNNRLIPIESHAISGGFGLSSLKLAVNLNREFTL